MLNIHQLYIFHIAADSTSLREAADRLHLTQPAVSQQIRRLEKHLGTRLFERSRRGVELTPAGRELQSYTLQILRLVARAEAAVTNVYNLPDGQISIGATPNVSSYLLPQWIQAFRGNFPNLTLAIQTDTTPRVVQGLLANRLEIGFVEGELTTDALSLASLPLQPLPHQIIVGPDHPMWGREQASIQDIHDQAFVIRQQGSQSYTWLNSLFKQHRVVPRITGEFDNPETLKRAVRNGTCMTILPVQAVEQDVAMAQLWAIPVVDVSLDRSLKLIWRENALFTPALHALLGYLQQHYPTVRELL